MQNRAVWWICGTTWDKHSFKWSRSSSTCLSDLNWLSVESHFHLLSCCQMFKLVHHLDCLVLDFLSFNMSTTKSHRLTLRSPLSPVNHHRFSFFVNASFLWNDLPFDILDCSSLYTFKSKLSRFLMSKDCSD